MRLRLNKAHYPVTALGPGRRIGVWFQGCSIGCRGCVSRDTWPAGGGYEVGVAEFLQWCRHVGQDGVDGITISGGEPFEQPEPLAALLDKLASWRTELVRPFDILCYSGLPLRRLETQYPELVARLDALIPEPYLERRARREPWAGSDNQALVLLTPLARERYETMSTGDEQRKRFQVTVTGRAIWLIGIPDRGDLEAVREACARDGLLLKDISWRA